MLQQTERVVQKEWLPCPPVNAAEHPAHGPIAAAHQHLEVGHILPQPQLVLGQPSSRCHLRQVKHPVAKVVIGCSWVQSAQQVRWGHTELLIASFIHVWQLVDVWSPCVLLHNDSEHIVRCQSRHASDAHMMLALYCTAMEQEEVAVFAQYF